KLRPSRVCKSISAGYCMATLSVDDGAIAESNATHTERRPDYVRAAYVDDSGGGRCRDYGNGYGRSGAEGRAKAGCPERRADAGGTVRRVGGLCRLAERTQNLLCAVEAGIVENQSAQSSARRGACVHFHTASGKSVK